MTEKELRRLSRKELLEILIDQTKEISLLHDKVQNLESQLNDKRISISESGSMAEAAIKLNSLLVDADKAARQYIENAKLNEEESRVTLDEAQKQADTMIAEAQAIRAQKIEEGNLYLNKVKNAIRLFCEKHPEVRRTLDEESQKIQS